MKIYQEDQMFSAITVKLESKSEASAMKSLVDKVYHCYASENREIKPDDLSTIERDLALRISAAFTEGEVSI
jgi:hypothetical protein